MTDEERLHMITDQLIIVRDNLFRGMSKSMQNLQARSINEVLELPNFTESPQRTWVGLTEEERNKFDHLFQMSCASITVYDQICRVEAKLKEKNNGT